MLTNHFSTFALSTFPCTSPVFIGTQLVITLVEFAKIIAMRMSALGVLQKACFLLKKTKVLVLQSRFFLDLAVTCGIRYAWPENAVLVWGLRGT